MTTAPVFVVAPGELGQVFPGGDASVGISPASGSGLAGVDVVLDGPEGHHAAQVRRVKPGERVDLVDGAGARAQCVVTHVERGRVVVRVESSTYEPAPSPRLVVVQALAKGDRGERAVELLTEVGVDEVVPWSAARSVVEWHGERGEKALQRWRSTAREASKQSRRARFTEVTAVATTIEVAARLATADLAVVLSGGATTSLASVSPPAAGEVVLVVGPEGDFSDPELKAFAEAGGEAVALGPTVMRTSTAGVVAAAVVLSRARW